MTKELEKRLRKLDAVAGSQSKIVEVIGVRLPYNDLRQILKGVQKHGSRLPIIHEPADEAMNGQPWHPESDTGL